MWSVIMVNVWRGMPFFAITLLAGLQTISPDIQEAAAIDGANAWQRFWRVTWPLLMPVTMVVMLFSVIQTFADFQLVYILTAGAREQHAPVRHVRIPDRDPNREARRRSGRVLAMFPFLFLVVVFQLWTCARRGTQHDRARDRASCGNGQSRLRGTDGQGEASDHGSLVEAVAVPVPPLGSGGHSHAVPVLLHGGDSDPSGPGDVHSRNRPNFAPFWTAHRRWSISRFCSGRRCFCSGW